MSQRECEIAPRCWRVYEALLSGPTSQMPINASPPNSRTRVKCMILGSWGLPSDHKTLLASVT
jgi:hypothetical protein